MMELEEYEDLHHYLEPVYKDMLKTGKALKTSKPAINALLSSWQSVSYFFVRFWKSSRLSQSLKSFRNLSLSSCFANFSIVSLAFDNYFGK